jgi:coenzyme F420-0:L-glutamate ligase / coenzyme F420-1:gamma-L-glutamate ligase
MGIKFYLKRIKIAYLLKNVVNMEIKIMGVNGIPLINKGDDLSKIIIQSIKNQGLEIDDGDVLIIAETAVVKAEGRIIDLKNIKTTEKALKLAKQTGKDVKLVEAIIRESKEIIKVGPDFIISETKHGFVCANAGIDESNVDIGMATPMPDDPDGSAALLRKALQKKFGKEIAVIIADTQGRTFREGAIGVAIGVSGINPLWDRSGELDLYGRELKTTNVAVADELSAAASLIMGQADEGIPLAIVKGFSYFKKLRNNDSNIKTLIRPKKYDVFR